MQEKKPDNFIASAAADRLIAAHDGDVALLYIYRMRTGCPDLEQAARDLCRTMGQMREAEEKLQRLNLLPAGDGADTPPPAAQRPGEPLLPGPEELPQYTAEEITRRTRGDSGFQAIVSDAERLMGRKLSSNDLRVLFGVYDALAMPTDVVLMLLNYCAGRCEQKYGGRRRLTARFIETEAYTWANREILTMEQAEEFIHAQQQRRSQQGQMAAAMDISGREPTPTEAQYIDAWLSMGFGAEAVAIAYDRTVSKTGQRPLRYMNSILRSWHEKGLHSPAEIEAKDGRGPRKGKDDPGVGDVSLDQLGDILERI